MSTTEKLMLGSAVPEFSVITTGGKTISSQSLLGNNVVLYFYPKDDTPGCTLEGQDFTLNQPAFKQLNCVVYGVSRDSLKSHEKFKDKYCFNFDLIVDEDESLCQSFDVIKLKNMYGKQVRGIERSTFLIDANGKICKIWRGVKVPGHVEAVLAELRKLG